MNSATPTRALLMLSASHTVPDPTEPKVPRYLQLSQWVSCNGLMKKSLSYLSLVQELEDSCPICVRPYNHGTSWDSGQVAGSPLCYISRAAVAAQKLEVLGAKLLGPSRKSSSWKQTENADKMDIRQVYFWYFWIQVCFKHHITCGAEQSFPKHHCNTADCTTYPMHAYGPSDLYLQQDTQNNTCETALIYTRVCSGTQSILKIRSNTSILKLLFPAVTDGWTGPQH